ncbi:MAG: 23S rRNA (uracil(1939)-C(5))-methyltransferase RlmD [Candidatus Latescibacteria bacterium]|jgi:23S rRNA (uracil1939-C5)-methyltransferase|nr:23S rRNA (uracil(1939)-C(5))-methyltransferase RlmD [Candidatus Latescibacterota bacterium]MBT4140535.1 23S rRNA (uracil(1939)-C(5))-methyltransferase RlmD [Candidatus Latescibacterota bacterium]MBT5829065.1 23S rRNA (uracil(1939)-C(5))-methyltransferase RlmD [Candidatus Latescibacterota bacterium]
MVKPHRGDVVDVTISHINEKGQGIGALDDYTVRVRGGVPGDQIRGYIRKTRNSRREIELKKTDLLDAETQRIEPRCGHFGTCGGCVWQDIPYESQVGIKQQLIVNCLAEAGIDLELDTPLLNHTSFFYRNKMEFSFGVSENGLAELGLHVPGRFDQVFDLEACFLQSESSNAIVAYVRDFVRSRQLSVYHLKHHEGLLRFLTIREGRNTDETMVILTTSGDDFGDAKELGEGLLATFSNIICVIQSVNDRKAHVAFGDEEILLAGRDHIFEKLGPFTFEISPSSFFQTNTHQAEELYRRVVALADPKCDDRVLDLYCGMGGISFFLSERVKHLLGIEVSDSAIQDAVRNSARNKIENCTFMVGQAEDLLGQLAEKDERFDLVVTDPPRVGMHPKALKALIKLRPNKIVYVSCNPQALVRDLKVFSAAGYQIEYGQLVDMFPHTPHCEVLVRLVDRQ